MGANTYQYRKVKKVGDLMTREPVTEAPVTATVRFKDSEIPCRLSSDPQERRNDLGYTLCNTINGRTECNLLIK